MAVIKHELVKTLMYYVPELEHSVMGYIYRAIDSDHLPYRWEISHFYRPNENAASVYRPSRHSADTAEEAEALLDGYAMNFTNIDVTPAR